jgi:hypothetical protein
MKNFGEKPLTIPCTLKVHSNYDRLDKLAEKLGFNNHGNDSSFCGWITTMGDSIHNPQTMMQEANEKLLNAQKNYTRAMIGLCQTGNFSVGYTIYTKGKFHA